jgi:hypothetical protein
LVSYRKGILDFCGTEVNTIFDTNEPDGMMCFMNFENGEYPRNTHMKTHHSNILRGVIVGKKSWGLWLNEWSDGISEGLFTLDEIITQFTDKYLLKEFNYDKKLLEQN